MTQLAITPRAESRLIPTAALAAVLAAAAAGWLFLVERMAGMGMGMDMGMSSGPGGDPGTLGWFAATWALMTAAMMLPAAAPAVARLTRARPSQAPAATAAFLGGYSLVWMLAGLAGYSLIEAVRALHPGALAWSAAGPYVAAGAVAAAGLYQLTNAKRRWLARCAALDVRRRPGLAGAVLTGAEHGGSCVACCGTLMAALYALGMMSITWMAVISALIVGERVLPRSTRVVPVVGAALIALGVTLAAVPPPWPG